MNKTVAYALRGFCVLLLVLCITTFLVFGAVLHAFNENNYQFILGDIAISSYNQQAKQSGSPLIDPVNAYVALAPQCEGQDSVVLAGIEPSVDIDCAPIHEGDEAAFAISYTEHVGRQAERVIEDDLETRQWHVLGYELTSFEAFFSFMRTVRILLALAAGILVGLVFWVSSPKYAAVTRLGFSGITLGIPFIMLPLFPLPAQATAIEPIHQLLTQILNRLVVYFLSVFLVGAFTLAGGLVWRHRSKVKKKQQ